jgi:hypothetical protein
VPAEPNKDKITVFRAALHFMVIFYGMLVIWTVGTAPLVYEKFQDGGWLKGDWLYGAMIVFFYLYTWYWVLGLFYFVSLDDDGNVVLRSLRRRLDVSARQIRTIEASRFPGGFGFVKFKLHRESGYLFCFKRNRELDEILEGIRKRNPLLRTVRI